jgi:hypothetical protein
MIRAGVSSPKLLQQVRGAARVRHYSPRTEESYVAWVKRYVRFHALRHPGELGVQEITQFLNALAESGRLSASSQTQALSALLFLYRDVLHRIPVRRTAQKERANPCAGSAPLSQSVPKSSGPEGPRRSYRCPGSSA